MNRMDRWTQGRPIGSDCTPESIAGFPSRTGWLHFLIRDFGLIFIYACFDNPLVVASTLAPLGIRCGIRTIPRLERLSAQIPSFAEGKPASHKGRGRIFSTLVPERQDRRRHTRGDGASGPRELLSHSRSPPMVGALWIAVISRPCGP
jgi:hypothetical protein